MKRLKILVVDYSAQNLRGAAVLLKDHELTLAGSFDEAKTALSTTIDHDKFERLKMEAGFTQYPEKGTADEKSAWRSQRDELAESACNRPDFDVVLTDLFLPASGEAQGQVGRSLVGQSMPIGTFIVLYAMKAGVKKIALVTNMNHHNHPASAAVDCLNGRPIAFEGVRILATNQPSGASFDESSGQELSDEFLSSDEGKKLYPKDSGWGKPHRGTFISKNWQEVLEKLLSDWSAR